MPSTFIILLSFLINNTLLAYTTLHTGVVPDYASKRAHFSDLQPSDVFNLQVDKGSILNTVFALLRNHGDSSQGQSFPVRPIKEQVMAMRVMMGNTGLHRYAQTLEHLYVILNSKEAEFLVDLPIEIYVWFSQDGDGSYPERLNLAFAYEEDWFWKTSLPMADQSSVQALTTARLIPELKFALKRSIVGDTTRITEQVDRLNQKAERTYRDLMKILQDARDALESIGTKCRYCSSIIDRSFSHDRDSRVYRERGISSNRIHCSLYPFGRPSEVCEDFLLNANESYAIKRLGEIDTFFAGSSVMKPKLLTIKKLEVHRASDVESVRLDRAILDSFDFTKAQVLATLVNDDVQSKFFKQIQSMLTWQKDYPQSFRSLFWDLDLDPSAFSLATVKRLLRQVSLEERYTMIFNHITTTHLAFEIGIGILTELAHEMESLDLNELAHLVIQKQSDILDGLNVPELWGTPLKVIASDFFASSGRVIQLHLLKGLTMQEIVAHFKEQNTLINEMNRRLFQGVATDR